MHSGLRKFDHKLGYKFGCLIVLDDKPSFSQAASNAFTCCEGFPAVKAVRKGNRNVCDSPLPSGMQQLRESRI